MPMRAKCVYSARMVETSPVRYVGLRVPDDLHAWLTAMSERDRRSLNSEVIVLLEEVKAVRERAERERGE